MMEKLKGICDQNSKLEAIKQSCRAYLVDKNNLESVTFVFYSLISFSDLNELSILSSFIQEFHDRECKLQEFLNRFTDMKYCISSFLSDSYFDSQRLSISEFLVKETEIFNFVFKIALSKDSPEENDMDLLNCLLNEGLTA